MHAKGYYNQEVTYCGFRIVVYRSGGYHRWHVWTTKESWRHHPTYVDELVANKEYVGREHWADTHCLTEAIEWVDFRMDMIRSTVLDHIRDIEAEKGVLRLA